MAAAADWSGHQGVDAFEESEFARLPRAAKAAVELDRGAAAAEAGYGVRLMKMLHSVGRCRLTASKPWLKLERAYGFSA